MATLPTFSAALPQSNDAVYTSAPVTYTTTGQPVTSVPVTTTMPVITAAPITTSAPITTTPTRTLPPVTYSSTSTPPISYGMPLSQSMNLGLGAPGRRAGDHSAFGGPPAFKFVKDDEFDMRSQASPSRSAWGELAGFPPPASSHMQEANRLDMEIAAHDQKVRDLAAQPLTVENLETQIQELLDGQESLRYELRQVKMQVEQNAHDLEGLRRQMPGDAFGSGYGTQYLAPPTAVSQPMPAPTMPRMSAPPAMAPSRDMPPAMAPSRDMPAMAPASPQPSRSQRVSLPQKRQKDAVHTMMGYNDDTLDLQSTTDYFSKAKDSAMSLSQTMRGYISGFQSQK